MVMIGYYTTNTNSAHNGDDRVRFILTRHIGRIRSLQLRNAIPMLYFMFQECVVLFLIQFGFDGIANF